MVIPLILRAHGSDADPNEILVVDRTPFRIGRKPENDAQVTRADISGRHAELQYRDGAWRLLDNHSTNGTFLNGKRVSEPTIIGIGDVVNFATKGYQVLAELDSSEKLNSTKVLEDSSEIKATMDLLSIINEQKTYPHFQPIVELPSRRVLGYEALGRGLTAGGEATAGPLFWLAAQSRVEHKLSHVFRESARFCAECRHCWTAPKGTHLFINLHPAELHQSGFLDSLREFGRTSLPRWYRVVIEMPEAWAGNADEMRTLMKEIRKLGMLVAYDDFGHGQSRIPDLIKSPPDFLKLDRQLIDHVHARPVQYQLVKAIVDACKELKVRTLAEGIELNEEWQACVGMNVELGQGYLIGKPQPAYALFQTPISTLPENCPFVKLRVLP